MAKGKYLSNYSIENIAQSIVRDSEAGKKYSNEDKSKLYEQGLTLLENFPKLKEIICLEHLRGYDNAWVEKLARLAVMPPQIIIADSRIQDMCYLPFWSYYGSGEGSFGRCAGVGNFSGCPPFNLKAEKVQERLNKADIFLVLQTRLGSMHGTTDPGEQFRTLNRLTDEINSLMGKGTVVQKFAGGPCFACFPEVCEGGGKCEAPHLKIPSLEGMGICVDQLCKDAAFLTKDESWKITWIKGFGTSDQKPKKMKGTVGLAISLNLQ
jgi:predicted metal-binding protein